MLSVKEAAAQRGISVQRFYQLLAAGRIFGIHRVGRTWVMDRNFMILPGHPRGAPGHVKRRKKP